MVQIRQSNSTNRISVTSANNTNLIKATNDKSEYYSNLAKGYADSVREYSVLVSQSLENIQETISEIQDIKDEIVECVRTVVFEQNDASDEWVINHNLGKYPSVTVVDSADNVITADIQYINENTCKIKAKGSFKGKAYLNAAVSITTNSEDNVSTRYVHDLMDDFEIILQRI